LIIKWQSALDSDFTTPTDILNTTNTLTGTDMGLSTTTFYRAVVQNCTCPIEYAIPAKISIALSQPGTALHGAMDPLQVLNPLFMQQTTPLMKISMLFYYN
jgi:hypothetical protein